ncbi:NUDIX hydrolase [uncultured Friedmanniella sp.]|uniref:NUDIX hydrolase n=1 Tax=uncultured Friedmanniella sp. TaxID=335381 RepID=UPI0035C99F2A
MRVVGVAGASPSAAETVFDVRLEHGADPVVVAHDEGYALVRPLEAVRTADADLRLVLQVRPLEGEPRPRLGGRGQDAGLVVPPGVQPEVRQRVAAYAVVVSSRGLLATEYSGRTAVEGRWGMPGGGIDAGEQPADAVLREVVEETSQHVVLGELVSVQTSHWIGRSPRQTIEDFQAVRLVYQASCPEPSEPRVLDLGGTTSSARWVPLEEWRRLPWTHNWQELLGELLGSG